MKFRLRTTLSSKYRRRDIYTFTPNVRLNPLVMYFRSIVCHLIIKTKLIKEGIAISLMYKVRQGWE